VTTGSWFWYALSALVLSGLGLAGSIYALAVRRDDMATRIVAGLGASMLCVLVFGYLGAVAWSAKDQLPDVGDAGD
jgi:hypothetical protein